jgi:signal transduction histidine kinase
VRDRGCGMDQAMVKRLQRGASSTGGRRGLGFRVVRELVASSGGRLQIESQPGVGTSISAEWSVVTEEEERSVRQEELRVKQAGAKRLVQGDAGWIAC